MKPHLFFFLYFLGFQSSQHLRLNQGHKLFRLISLLLISCCLGSGGRAAQREKYGAIEYTPPLGWKKGDHGSFLSFSPPDLTASARYFLILTPGTEYSGDFQTAFDKIVLQSINAGERLVHEQPVQTFQLENGLQPVAKAIMVENTDGSNRTFRLYLGFNTGQRIEIGGALTNQPELLKKYQDVAVAFFSSWTLGSSAAQETRKSSLPAPKPSPQSQEPVASHHHPTSDIQGLYVANVLYSRAKSFGGFGYEYINQNEFWLFLPGGRVFFGLPPQNPATFDFNQVCQTTPERCSTYRLKQGNLEFQWYRQLVSFPQGKEQIDLGQVYSMQSGSTVFRKVPPESNLRLKGSFSRSSFADTSNTTTTGSVSSEQTITFSQDGTFSLTGFSGFTTSTPTIGATGVQRTSRAGTYSIRGYWLELTYPDQRQERLFFFRFPGEEDQVICIDGVNYVRQSSGR